ncbi:hypothetical protein [Streptomyces sp. NPDC007346]|uniref:hypothetical protein n=1 Tax=Streptomyces sp. NPDC007346 TaxID=3154682 RepID=UPI0034528799
MTLFALLTVPTAVVVILLAAASALWAQAVRGLDGPVDQAHAETGPDEGDVLAVRFADGEVDALDMDHCQIEQHTTPHAYRADGSRRCWSCGHDTPGVQT